MSVWKKQVLIYFEIIGYFVIGFILTENVLTYIYEYYDIPFMGNVWVNWFGVSYFCFFICTITCSQFVIKIMVSSENALCFWREGIMNDEILKDPDFLEMSEENQALEKRLLLFYDRLNRRSRIFRLHG
ncbi:hypothetical protein ACINKY_17560 [Paenibacillus illinoisensis]|uniref:Uncharacterized protein n=1 Tax=Paenibacillus illinoisensis TaxID=59845 RepID=A0ABW8HWG2_9BACL